MLRLCDGDIGYIGYIGLIETQYVASLQWYISFENRWSMFQNYLKTALRNLLRRRLYTFINLFGLSVGLAFVILILLFIRQELSFDHFHANLDHIFRVEEMEYQQSGITERTDWLGYPRPTEGIQKYPYLPLALGPTLQEELPEIQRFTRYDRGGAIVRRDNKSFTEDINFVDSTFFEIFSFSLLEGDPDQVLQERNTVVITPEIARKYFGNKNPIGETLSVQTFDTTQLFTVSGIAQRPPDHSSIDFQILMRVENKPFYQRQYANWNSFNTPLFLELADGTSAADLAPKLQAFTDRQFEKYIAEQRSRYQLSAEAPVFTLPLTALKDVHLNSSIEWLRPGNATNILILGTIALLILLIAGLNYISLSLAGASGRMREVGVRKVLGSTPRQIARQFWVEAQVLAIAAILIAVALVELALPLFNEFVERDLSMGWRNWLLLLPPLALIALVTGLLSGSYPAWVLARFRPVSVLKSNSTYRYQPGFIKVAVVVQFALSVFLMLSSLVMYRQMRFVNQKDLGYDKDHVLVLQTNTGWTDEGARLLGRLREALKDEPRVGQLSGTNNTFSRGWDINGFETPDGKRHRAFIYSGDYNYLDALGLELVAGRNFSIDHPTDSTRACIVNEALAADLGLTDPIGAEVPWRDYSNVIVGVVKDFNFLPLTEQIQPALIHMNPEEGKVLSILAKIQGSDIPGALAAIERAWRQAAPAQPFDYSFLDEDLAAEYAAFRRWLGIMGVATAFALLIACMGLFGLAGIMALNKTKEIGIRKVLGASLTNILTMLNRDLVRLALLALLLAAPAGWYVMHKWLGRFEYRIAMSWELFAVAGLACLTVALLTVSYHSLRAARRNPVDSLKYE